VKQKKVDDVMSEPPSSSTTTTTNGIPIEVSFKFDYLVINENWL